MGPVTLNSSLSPSSSISGGNISWPMLNPMAKPRTANTNPPPGMARPIANPRIPPRSAFLLVMPPRS